MALRRAEATIPTDLAGKPLDRVVKSLFDLSWQEARGAVRSGKVAVGAGAEVVTDRARAFSAGTRVVVRPEAPRPHVAAREAFERSRIVHLDAAVVVVDKPPGISTVPFGDEGPDAGRGTLDAIVREIVARRRGRAPLGVVHRLDKETSGLVVFTRTLAAKKHLANQFRQHTTTRRYVAIVHAAFAKKRTFRSHLVEDRGDGLRGTAPPGNREGRLAITHAEPVRRLRGATLVACRLETGRTHQIRIHLSEAGHPLVGERVYVRGYGGDRIEAPRLMLHAATLGFEHPTTGERMEFESEAPDDFQAVLRRLEARGP